MESGKKINAHAHTNGNDLSDLNLALLNMRACINTAGAYFVALLSQWHAYTVTVLLK